MEVDPFQDTVPPRHQIESDESDEDVYPSSYVKKSTPRPVTNVVIVWKGPQEKRQPLLVSLYQAGRQWAMGVKLDEAKGKVMINDIEVASIHVPSWAETTIVCTNTRLPISMCHEFASTLIATIRPTIVVVLDAYSTPSYISSSPSVLHSPIRYLRTTAASKDSPPLTAEPFLPPNLIQSVAASFLAILERAVHSIPATLLLLPSAHIAAPAPSELEGRSGPELQEEWESSTLEELHKIVENVLGFDTPWTPQHLSERSGRKKASRRGDIGEGGMYI